MPTGKVKTACILVAFSLVTTALLLAATLVFLSTSAPEQNSGLPGNVFYIDPNSRNLDLEALLKNPDAYLNPISMKTIENYYRGEFFRYAPLLMTAIFMIVFLCTIVLWRILSGQNEKSTTKLVTSLIDIEQNQLASDDTRVLQAYGGIQSKLNAFANDYMRLSSYIAHEQKNAFSRLRAKLQLSGSVGMLNEVDKIVDGIDDILTVSATRKMEHEDIIDTALLCAEVCADYRKTYPNIDFDFDEEINTQIHGRELWIRRAVSNLIDNAIKYGNGMPVHVHINNKNGSVILSVSDQGIGIDDNQCEQIFEYQYRINGLNKNGYGIGLYLVRHGCELCDGFVWMESKIGRGSTFYMSFHEA